MKLMKTFAALAFALCATLASAADADPPSVVGRLNYISGPVSFAPAQANDDWSAATLNRPITTGDRLWTDSSGRAEMHVGSLAVRMASQTSLDVLNLDDRTFQLRLAQGSVNLRVRRLSSDKLLEIATPSGAVVVREPGSYRISVDPAGAATMVTVRDGQAEVFTGNSSFLVRDNQEASIAGGRQDLFAAPPADEFDRWAATRDQREDHVASTRYVPDEMTGYEDLDQHGTWRTVPNYGAVWAPTTVPAGWAPYRNGHWVWVSPWGWTWVDSAPWGFAPFHYGRWVWLRNHWAWAPGRIVARPVYAPALVAFVGGSNWSVSVGAGPAVGWVPLGWREPYRPWYRASRAHVRNVNVTHVTNVNNITNNVTNVRLVNRNAPSAVTVVSRESFVAARRADQAALRVDARTLAAAPVTRGAPVATPARTSLAAAQRGSQPPAAARTRETVAVNTPPAPAREAIREARKDARNARLAGNDERPRVRVINRGERVNLQQAAEAPRAGVPAPQAPQAQSPAETPRTVQPAPQPAQTDRNVRGQDKAVAQPQPAPQPAQADRNVRAPEKAAPQVQPNQQAERRAPAPPPEVSRRPTFDREMKASTPGAPAQSAADAQRPQAQQAERGNRAERAEDKGQGQAQRSQEKAASQPQPALQAERRAPAPPSEVSRRPTFDREMRQTAPQAGTPSPAEARREQRQAERQERREQGSGQGGNTPQVQSAPQPETRSAPRPAPDQRSQQQDQQRQQQAQEQHAREQQARQRETQQQVEQQRAQQQRAQQQAQEQQAREQQARQRELQQREGEQRAQQQRAQQQAQEQQAREQQARQRELQQREGEQQRAQQQRAQQQAQQQQAREQQARQREMQQQGERQRAQQQQELQRQQQAQAQQAQRQQEMQQQREQRQRENVAKPAPQAAPAADRRPPPQQRPEQAREKDRDRQRAAAPEKG